MNRAVDYIMGGSRYYQMNKKRVWRFGIVVLFMVIIFSVFFISKTVTAQRAIDRQKLVTMVEVKKGDTLWSIATSYITDEYKDMNDYIDEIKDSNGMLTDEIHTGNYIIVPYYADASAPSVMLE